MARSNGSYGSRGPRARRSGSQRAGETFSLGQFAASQRARIYDGGTPERRQQFEAAERRAQIMHAWNEVCANTREGKHVTGLYYVPEADELVVYTDGSTWTQELTMMREIIRARMEFKGGRVGKLTFKTSRDGYARGGVQRGPQPNKPAPAPKKPLPALPEAERAAIAEQTSAIADPKLRQALKNAMEASAAWRKSKNC